MKKVKVFSRHLLGLGLFLSSAIIINAQADLAYVNLPTSDAYVSAVTKTTYELDHTEKAVRQLSEHIAKHVEYPEYLRSLQVEGRVVVEVELNADGTIAENRIVQIASSGLNNAVMKSLSGFDAIKLDNRVYQGVTTVHIPIHFKN
jgi:TonB family protein